MARELKEISEFVNAINKIDLAQIEVEIEESNALGTLAGNATIKVKITPPTHELVEIAPDKKSEV